MFGENFGNVYYNLKCILLLSHMPFLGIYNILKYKDACMKMFITVCIDIKIWKQSRCPLIGMRVKL